MRAQRFYRTTGNPPSPSQTIHPAGTDAPVILKASDALASSGTIKVLAWQDHVLPNVVEAFEGETGIKLELATYGSNDEAESTVCAAGGNGFDVVFPSITNSANDVDDSGESFFAPSRQPSTSTMSSHPSCVTARSWAAFSRVNSSCCLSTGAPKA